MKTPRAPKRFWRINQNAVIIPDKKKKKNKEQARQKVRNNDEE